jgi:hypothetical protein
MMPTWQQDRYVKTTAECWERAWRIAALANLDAARRKDQEPMEADICSPIAHTRGNSGRSQPAAADANRVLELH